ncbi:hypothetical protein POF50_032410 [Streptomyces sp. SL13]|uniref:Uncharacterized protein n=1 Tax=Streptantibioticus silvisoli TaxID=2705255 RepID=A0AA90KK01_9ACTN|nr:hypothetical protein [Streptantibioticus silvisoli]MDI5973994.1 hypothetical protein [Streptantibioticus silvisoli]
MAEQEKVISPGLLQITGSRTAHTPAPSKAVTLPAACAKLDMDRRLAAHRPRESAPHLRRTLESAPRYGRASRSKWHRRDVVDANRHLVKDRRQVAGSAREPSVLAGRLLLHKARGLSTLLHRIANGGDPGGEKAIRVVTAAAGRGSREERGPTPTRTLLVNRVWA